MVSTARVNGSGRVPRQSAPRGGAPAALDGAAVWSWVDAVPGEFKRVVSLPAADAEWRRRAPRFARLTVAAALADWGIFSVPCPDPEEDLYDRTSLFDTAAGAVSELVTNAVLHVEWERVKPRKRVIGLTVVLLHDRLLVEVSDPQPAWVRRDVTAKQVGSMVTRGRGLWLVDAYMGLWGGDHGERELPLGGGKAVWFTVPVRAGPP